MDTTTDYSDALRSALTEEALCGWRTSVPGCLSLLFWSLAILMDSTLLGIIAGLLLIVSISFAVLTKTVWAAEITAKFKLTAAHQRDERTKNLKKELSSLGCTQGVAQLGMLTAKFTNFTQMLDRQFKRSELAHGRYSTMGNDVYNGAIDNLDRVARCLVSVATIKPEEIRARQNELLGTNVDGVALVTLLAKTLNVQKAIQERPPLTKAATAEMAQLDARLELRDKQHAIADDCLAINEQAIMQFDVVTAELANITTKGSRLKELEDAIAELKRLVESTAKYDIEFSN